MRLITYFIVGLSVGLIGCAEKKQVEPAMQDTAAPAVQAPAPETEVEEMGTSAFIEHMHHHASQLGQLKAALEVGSLAAAQRPAYWLAGHDEVGGVPEGWEVFIDGMREGANGVESAQDIAGARAAAMTIEANCRGCHDAAGIEVPNLAIE